MPLANYGRPIWLRLSSRPEVHRTGHDSEIRRNEVKLTICFFSFVLTYSAAETKNFRGWLSDEACARARATAGVYTATNPVCAKQCIKEGKKIVFVDPTARMVLDISNQEAARNNIGDEVSVLGSMKPNSNVLQINSLKLISHGIAECARQKGSSK